MEFLVERSPLSRDYRKTRRSTDPSVALEIAATLLGIEASLTLEKILK